MSINIDTLENIEVLSHKRWLSPAELEIVYGFSQSTQAKMRMSSSSSNIPFSKIGSKYIRYDRLAIDNWLQNHLIQGA